MNITIDQLIEIIGYSTKKIKVHTPSTSWYAERGDHDVDELEYICPHDLITHLNTIKANAEEDR